MSTRIRSRGHTGRDRIHFDIQVRLFTDETFPLKHMASDMKILDLKKHMEFAAGIPVHMQKISYLDSGDMLDRSTIRGNDIVPGATLNLTVWPMWKDLIEAASLNDIEWVLTLGITNPSTYRTPQSDYMIKKARKAWLEERGFLALYIAAHRGHEKLVRRLIDIGVDLNASTPCGRTALHVAASQGRGNIVDILLEKGADIDAEDNDGANALAVAARFNHKSCERHLFLFRWQERAKRTKPSAEAKRMAHQYYDSAFPVWISGMQSQLYFTNILPPGEFEGTRLNSPKKKTRDPKKNDDYGNGHEESFETDDEDADYDEDGNFRLPVIREERQKSRQSRAKSKTFSYDDWLNRKKSLEQRAIDIKKAAKEKIRQEEEERKRLEAEKSQSYETWLAQREAEKKKVEFQRQRDDMPLTDKGPGALRAYLRSLGKTRAGDTYEDWLNQKEAELKLAEFRSKSAKALTSY